MKPIVPSRAFRNAALIMAASLALAAAPAATAKGPLTEKSFEGVWQVTKVVQPNGTVDAHPQPSLQIFSRGYFSIIRDTGAGPRPPGPPPKDPATLTEAEKMALYQEWADFAASGGTYEVKGDILFTRNLIAKRVGGIGRVEQAVIRFDGNTFTAQPRPGEPNAGRQTTYTRIR
jgi:hypothetical protein